MENKYYQYWNLLAITWEIWWFTNVKWFLALSMSVVIYEKQMPRNEFLCNNIKCMSLLFDLCWHLYELLCNSSVYLTLWSKYIINHIINCFLLFIVLLAIGQCVREDHDEVRFYIMPQCNAKNLRHKKYTYYNIMFTYLCYGNGLLIYFLRKILSLNKQK